jgi:hypothetical protein
LLDDGFLERRGIGGLAGRQNDEEALSGELLGDRAADAPPYAHREIAVIEHLAVRQPGVAPIGLPLGGRPDHDGDLFAG